MWPSGAALCSAPTAGGGPRLGLGTLNLGPESPSPGCQERRPPAPRRAQLRESGCLSGADQGPSSEPAQRPPAAGQGEVWAQGALRTGLAVLRGDWEEQVHSRPQARRLGTAIHLPGGTSEGRCLGCKVNKQAGNKAPAGRGVGLAPRVVTIFYLRCPISNKKSPGKQTGTNMTPTLVKKKSRQQKLSERSDAIFHRERLHDSHCKLFSAPKSMGEVEKGMMMKTREIENINKDADYETHYRG